MTAMMFCWFIRQPLDREVNLPFTKSNLHDDWLRTLWKRHPRRLTEQNLRPAYGFYAVLQPTNLTGAFLELGRQNSGQVSE
jgi:hypothetical protein